MVNRTDPDGRIWSNIVGGFVGGLVEYGGQIVANRYEGKDWKESFTDIDVADVTISAGEGFLTSGTSAVKSLARKTIVTLGSEVLRNKFDVNKDGLKIKSTTSVVINTAVGLVATGAAKAVPGNIKVKAEVTPKQAVKAAREGGAINRVQRKSVQTSAVKTLKTTKEINKTVSEAPASTVTGAAGEATKRKGDKIYGNGK